MGANAKRLLACVAVGLVAAPSARAQAGCHYEGNVLYCEHGEGEYVAPSTRTGTTTRSTSTAVLLTSAATSGSAAASTTAAVAPSHTESASTAVVVTALGDCHMHGTVQYCVPEPTGEELAVATLTSAGQVLPTAYSDCHDHDGEVYCVTPDGQDVPIHALEPGGTHEDHDDHAHEVGEHEGHEEEAQSCHFHAGIEHCTGGSSEEDELTCERPDRVYNVPIRIGSLFIVLFTSSAAVFGPILLRRFSKGISTTGLRFTAIKQFGTGVIISTAFVHLLTHAALQFASRCLGELEYEATTTAIAMAGAFLTFLVEYCGGRYVMRRRSLAAAADGRSPESGSIEEEKTPGATARADVEAAGHCHDINHDDDQLSVWVMEAGIIFHSILIGITTVVAGDSGFWTLLIVIIFHQMFEGLALGSRISTLSTISTRAKCLMAAAFACITPLGMMIGIIVLRQFNGSDKTTIIALGTLNALSAGILIWVGFVEMWAADWLHGDLKRAGIVKTAVAMASLVAGMLLMGVLGKWA